MYIFCYVDIIVSSIFQSRLQCKRECVKFLLILCSHKCGTIYTRFHEFMWWRKNRRGESERRYEWNERAGEWAKHTSERGYCGIISVSRAIARVTGIIHKILYYSQSRKQFVSRLSDWKLWVDLKNDWLESVFVSTLYQLFSRRLFESMESEIRTPAVWGYWTVRVCNQISVISGRGTESLYVLMRVWRNETKCSFIPLRCM